MSKIGKHHAEWLQLCEPSGPFLSRAVLVKRLPQGLNAHDPEVFRELKLALAGWEDAADSDNDLAAHQEWIQFILRRVLEIPPEVVVGGQSLPTGLEARTSGTGEVLRPEMAVINAADTTEHGGPGRPRLLISIYRRNQKLEAPVNSGGRWVASPASRMAELLLGTGCPLGLVTNGEHWMLVHARAGEPSGFASWYASLWRDEKVTLQSFRTLLGVRRFFAVGADDTLEALLSESRQDHQEVTDQLGYQVRRAVEVIVHAIDRIDKDRKRELLRGVTEPELYEAALTVMMRLVFLFCAEERKLLLLGEPLYDQHYAVSPLAAQLRETADRHGEEVLEFRTDAWCRLLTTFRAVFGGIEHDRLRLIPYGGGLFDPDRFPFLEGRRREAGRDWRTQSANPLPINNRTVLHLLEALQFLQIKMAGGPAEPRRLSFRALDIEQIGHVYEGLLDHTAKKATGPTLGLTGTREREPEIPLAVLEAKLRASRGALVEFLAEETGRAPKAVTKDLEAAQELIASANASNPRLLAACDNDAALLDRIRPFAALIRLDDLHYPIVVNTGSFFVTQGQDRRSTGTQYTPRSLTEPVVQHALDPLVFTGPADDLPREQWVLKASREILSLKVCDMACGSGAFLVQAARYLSERLVESWETIEAKNPGKVIVTPEGDLSKGDPGERPLPRGREERLAVALRVIAQRCLFGVDINPLACEMAKLSLWLLTVAKDKPFTFLDHAVRCGDSLLGLHDIEQVKRFTLDPTSEQQFTFSTLPLTELVQTASTARSQLESIDSSTIGHVAAQGRLLQEAENRTVRLKLAVDLLIAGELAPEEDDASREDLRNHAATQAGQFLVSEDLSAFRDAVRAALNGKRPFHWCLEFPEVFNRGGFDAVIGNPPFMHGSWISSRFGDNYANLLRSQAPEISGKVDYVIHFLQRATRLCRDRGTFGLILTAKANQGDARLSGFATLASKGYQIYFARTDLPWPGSANVLICIVHSYRGHWTGPTFDSHLAIRTDTANEGEEPHELAENRESVYLGAKPDSLGFVLSVDSAAPLLTAATRSVLRPYFSGTDLNDMAVLVPPRYIIDFTGMSLAAASAFPELLAIVERDVKPKRITLKRSAYSERWWQFTEPQAALFRAIRQADTTIAVGRVSKYFTMRFVKTDCVYSDKVVVFVRNTPRDLAILSSAVHQEWALRYGTTHGAGTPNYKPTECARTFVWPSMSSEHKRLLDSLGVRFSDVRDAALREHGVGPTGLYNLFHFPERDPASVVALREEHAALDRGVVAAYGWDDLIEKLQHGFYPTKQGERFTIHPDARAEILARLLALNHQRYAEEVAAGLHDNGGAESKGARRKPKAKQLKVTAAAAVEDGGLFAPRTQPASGKVEPVPVLQAVEIMVAILDALKPAYVQQIAAERMLILALSPVARELYAQPSAGASTVQPQPGNPFKVLWQTTVATGYLTISAAGMVHRTTKSITLTNAAYANAAAEAVRLFKEGEALKRTWPTEVDNVQYVVP